MKLNDKTSYSFKDVFNINSSDVNKVVKPLEELKIDNGNRSNIKQAFNDISILSYVCKQYIYYYQIIVDILWLVLVPLGIALFLFVNKTLLVLPIVTIYILRVFTYFIQCHHPFIKKMAEIHINKTARIVNEYYNINHNSTR